MQRTKKAQKVYSYLESTINCQKVMRIVDRNTVSNEDHPLRSDPEERVVELKSVPTAYVKMHTVLPSILYDEMIRNFDRMTEINHMGFEYFPYLYGVLNCHDGIDQTSYIFYENTDRSIHDLILSTTNIQEWYDLAFQVAMMDYYLMQIYKYEDYVGVPKYFRVIDYEKAFYKEYIVEEMKVSIYHKFQIVYWKLDPLTVEKQSGVQMLYNIISDKDLINKPPRKVLEMLQEITLNPSATLSVLGRYYQWKERKVNNTRTSE
jgi:hypothetical protein